MSSWFGWSHLNPQKCGKTQNTYLKDGVSVFDNDGLFAVLTLGQSPGAAEDQPAARCHHRCPRDECHYRVPDPCAGAQWEQFSIVEVDDRTRGSGTRAGNHLSNLRFFAAAIEATKAK